MDGKEAIINKIISDAEARSTEMIAAAEKYADEVKASAEEWAKDFSSAREIALKKEAEEIVERRKIVAALDVKKIILNAKRETLDKIYSEAEKKICAADKKTYLGFVLKEIAENAEIGDEVILSSDGVLTEKDIADSEIAKEKKIKVKKVLGDFIGGVYLVGKTSDKDLTFHEAVEREKERSLSIVADKVFSD